MLIYLTILKSINDFTLKQLETITWSLAKGFDKKIQFNELP